MDKTDFTKPNMKKQTKKQEEKPKIIIEKLEIEAKDLEPVLKELVLQEGEAKCDRCQMAFEERLAYRVGMAENIQWGEYQDNDKNITVSTAMKDLKFDTICDTCYNTSIDSNTGSITKEWFD